ncbi:MAG TPA: radical SAM protein [Spirochaetota bacterium]|nr:radical SAM protein [Spirochaetota bacterium]HPJ33236.1 radical SAM protein [Spirochaetota bacterium]
MYEFELGPIRPPSEAYSILLRITRNCPWNKCAFCPVYKGQKFSLRSVEEIKADIDSMYAIAEKVYERISRNGTGQLDERTVSLLLNEDNIPQYYLQQMIFWMHYGMKSLFLQDADSMVMKPGNLVEILKYIREKFPSIERITCYSRSKTLVARTPDEMKEIRAAGLNRIHIGMESGSDAVLKLIKKGVTGDEHISSGRKVVEAGFELSEYFMPGIGGKALTDENAEDTARVLNAINPSFIRIRTTTPVQGTELRRMMDDGEWIPLSEKGKVEEIRYMISLLEGITSFVQSDHMMNLIEDANGKFPEEREAVLKPFDSFLSMSEDDQECFIVGRRTGQIRFLADYRKTSQLEDLRDRMKSMYGTIDNAAMEMTGRFI